METPMSLGSNREICHCKKVTYLDIEKALHENEKFSDVEKAFESCNKQQGAVHQHFEYLFL